MKLHPAYPETGRLALLLALCFVAIPLIAPASTFPPANPEVPTGPKPATKELRIPARIGRVPEGNDYNNPDSEFCYQRSKSSDNFLLLWAKEYGDDPMANAVANRRFNVDEVLKEAERFYTFYIDSLKWADPINSASAKYKFLFFVVGGKDNSAYGGNIDGNIGGFWTPATRINRGPYGVIAHELGHSFQYLCPADGAASFTGFSVFAEMTSQFMLWQVYPEWQIFENDHLKAFMKATHLAFMHPDNKYHTCYPLEYWSGKHGVEFIGKMWREVKRGEDPVMTYKRLTKISQEQFNDEMFDACRRFVTWDLPRIEVVAARYADQHFTPLNRTADGWYQIGSDKCPQNYGYNAIQLKVPAADTKVSLTFKGIAGAEGFSQTRLDNAGWRYGFLVHKADGSRVYSEVFRNAEGKAEFTVPAETKFLWLVVMGAPTEHWLSVNTPRKQPDGTAVTVEYEQWPYKFSLNGTEPEVSKRF